ncbi:hypothetical protein FOZ62_001202, partial [Perkinsus olseni]
MILLPSPPTRGTRLYPCIEEEEADEEDAEGVQAAAAAGQMVASLVDCLGQLDLYPKDPSPMISTQAAEVPPKGLSRSASTSAMLAVGRREAAAAGRPVRAVAGGREEGALPSVQAVKGLHKSVQFATLPHTLWPVVVESSRPSCGAMTPSPPSATSDARPSRPGIEDVDSTPVTLGCPLCDMKVVKEEEDTTAWSRVYHHIQHHHRSGLLRSGLLRVTLPGNPTSILYTCHRHECWTLPAKPRSRRESRVGPKTPEGLVESSRGEERPNRGRHFHCPLCGVLCVADHSGEGVK